MSFSSTLLENAVNEFAKLPGIGKKTALRLALHLIKQPEAEAKIFGETIVKMRQEIMFCKRCHNISDTEICHICNNPMRQQQHICVVETIRDVLAIENTQQFNGLYHVLGGIISPLDGIGPHQLTIDPLIERLSKENTIYYITKKLNGSPVKITTIARGIAFGGELEYADEITLGKSISNRIPVVHYVNNE